MTQEALKLALEALTYIYTETTADEDELIDQAITAIKEALAQTQEPVAWMYVNTDGECEQIEYGEPFDDPSTTPLYTTPPQRKWGGLTDEERSKIWGELPTLRNEERDACVFAEAIELYLKEKNT